jgi:hypothetical protein
MQPRRESWMSHHKHNAPERRPPEVVPSADTRAANCISQPCGVRISGEAMMPALLTRMQVKCRQSLQSQRAKANLVVPLHLPGTRIVASTHNPSIPPPTRARPCNALNSRTPGTVPRARAQSGRVRGSPNRGSTLISKRVIAQIWPPARANTITPFA